MSEYERMFNEANYKTRAIVLAASALPKEDLDAACAMLMAYSQGKREARQIIDQEADDISKAVQKYAAKVMA